MNVQPHARPAQQNLPARAQPVWASAPWWGTQAALAWALPFGCVFETERTGPFAVVAPLSAAVIEPELSVEAQRWLWPTGRKGPEGA